MQSHIIIFNLEGASTKRTPNKHISDFNEWQNKQNQNPGWYCWEETNTRKEITWIEKPSDGVVLSESASDIPQQTHPPQIMDGNKILQDGNLIEIGTTHMELRNDITTKKALNE